MDVERGVSSVGRNEQTVAVAEQLDRYLGPEYLSYRRGEGGRMLAYAEGHEVINLMNTIFEWDGWNSKVVNFVTDYAEGGHGGKWNVGVAATVRLTVLMKGKDQDVIREVSHEDIGYGTIDNGPSRGKAMEKCRKEAVTDGLKIAARHFWNATGNCLYNKEYLERAKRVMGPADRIEFVEDELFRKPMNKMKRLMMMQDNARAVNGMEEFGETSTFNVQHRQEEVDWRQFDDFMYTRTQELPYPPYLYRAHTYRYPIPRFRDDMTEEFCDSFGSDMHTMFKEEGQGFSLSTPRESLCTIGDLVKEIARHLKKTQINADQMRKRQGAYFSEMVSLSGDLLWTMHTACQRGKMAKKDQVAGLAIFETLKIKESGVCLWRVKDLLDFFDSNPRFGSSRIDSFARTWARNADEYLCWDLVPKEALLNFVRSENLAQREDKPEDILLRSVFFSSKTLGVYRKLVYPLETLTADQYRNRDSNFMMGVMDHVACHVNADSFVNTMVGYFRDSSQWGYSLAPGGEDLEVMLRRVINGKYAWGVSRWIDSHREFSCVCEKVYNDRIEAACVVIKE